ncbi:FixH family protein [Vineibacter terrae]|uniref:FixH family protein n=1 Tax=Vineibacter terrae TaxID=2586908 RepID=UPI002E301C08|nr:hypothetical protein [Vineibacter terrae]HEX2887234.1 hypothetical protein [Vineibacter terrae]
MTLAGAGWPMGLPVVGAGVVVVVAAAAAAQACQPSLAGEAVRLLRAPAYAVAYRTEPRDLAVGAPFAIELAVCAAAGAADVDALAVDAEMPAHRHGMNYRPSVSARGDGRYRIEGLLFHMPGHWRLTVELRAGARVERLADDLQIE